MRVRLARAAGSFWSDALLAAALFTLAQVELWGGSTYQGSSVFPGSRLATSLLVIPLMTVPLAARRVAPLACFALVMATVACSSLVLGGSEAASFFIVALVSIYSAAANGVRVAIAVGGAVGALGVHALRDPHVKGVGDVVWAAGLAVLGLLFGLAVRDRHRRINSLEGETVRLQAAQEEHARAAVADERQRIARELHDIVAHAVSVVVVQAQAGQRLVGTDDGRARESLEAIEETGRRALVEMRRLLGMLREVDGAALAPQPGLGQLDALVAHVRDAGLDVSVEVAGDPVPLAPGVDLSAFRVLQEGLTNSLKHANAAHAVVRVRYATEHVELEVSDDGSGSNGNAGPGGHGLVGMRERVALYGGRLESGPRAEGGWALRVQLPLEGQT